MKAGSLIRGGLWITYATFITRLFSFLSSLVLARLLQPSDFGVIGIAYVFWSFFTLFTQSTAGTFILYKGTDNPKYVNTSYTISLLLGALLGLGMVVAAPAIAGFFNEPALTGILIAFAFNLVLSSACYVYSGVMTRQMQYRTLANISLVAAITRLSCTALSAASGLSYWSFVVGDTASWAVNWVLTRHYSGKQFKLEIDPEVRSEVMAFCVGANGSSFGLYVNFNLDNFVVGKMLGSASLGYYNLAYQLTTALSTVFNPVLNQLGVPAFAQLEDEKQQSALLKVVEQIGFLIAPICALMFLTLDPQVITFMFGERWIPICTVLPGLLVFSYFRVVNSPLFSMMVAKGRPDINAMINLQIAPIAVIGFMIGAHLGGIVGVSIAVALILGLVWTLHRWWFSCRKLHWPLNPFLMACFVPILLSLPGIALAFKLPLIAKPFVFLITYLLCLRLFVPDQLSQYQHLLTRLTKRIARLRTSH